MLFTRPTTISLSRGIAFNPKIPIGEVVGPVKTKFGHHLFKLEYRTGFEEDKSRAKVD